MTVALDDPLTDGEGEYVPVVVLVACNDVASGDILGRLDGD